MTQYRRKPQTVEAFKWMPSHETMDGHAPVPDWLPENDVRMGTLRIQGPVRTLYALPGEWVLKEGLQIWICPPETFEKMYEPLGAK